MRHYWRIHWEECGINRCVTRDTRKIIRECKKTLKERGLKSKIYKITVMNGEARIEESH